MRWVVLLVALTWCRPIHADFALPTPGCKLVPCEVEIEVPGDLNGFRLYLVTPRRPVHELTAGTTNRLFDFGDGRDTSGYLVAVADRDLEFVDHGQPLADIISCSLPDQASKQISLRVYLRTHDSRSKVGARYRIDRVAPIGIIEMTILHLDDSVNPLDFIDWAAFHGGGGWTGWVFTGIVGVLLAVVAFVVGSMIRQRFRPDTPPMPSAPPMVRLDPDEE